MSDKRLDCGGVPKASPTCLCLCTWCVNNKPGCCAVVDGFQCPMEHCPDYCERPEGMRAD